MALADQPAVPFRVPPGIKLIRVDPKTGLRATGGGPSILEGFKPGTAPPDSAAVIGMGTGDTIVPTGDADRAVRSGTGGLY
jgi:penicillin-binding protein 1A